MKRLAIVFLALATAAALWAAPSVRRGALASFENAFATKLENSGIEILALPRGVYLEGYGAVFSTDVMLTFTPTINPFRLTIDKDVIAAIYHKKLTQMPVLRAKMQEILVDSGSALNTVPTQEQVVLVVTLGNEKWETTGSLPSQIYMQAQRAKLIQAKLGKVKPETIVKVQEL